MGLEALALETWRGTVFRKLVSSHNGISDAQLKRADNIAFSILQTSEETNSSPFESIQKCACELNGFKEV